jgi:hypothetical protein
MYLFLISGIGIEEFSSYDPNHFTHGINPICLVTNLKP